MAIPLSIAAVACASDAAAKVDEVVLLESTQEAAACNEKRSPDAGIDCYRAILAPYRWEIITTPELGQSGADDAFVTDATGVLERLVDDCDLGRAILNHHTDGVAALHIGGAGLSEEQIGCIRSFERPGLTLQESQGF